MKNIFSLFLLVITLTLVACGDNKKNAVDNLYIRPASVVFTQADTASINKLVETFVEQINNGDLSQASSMLYYLDKGEIDLLPLEKRQEFEKFLANMPHYGCEVVSFRLNSKKDNKIELAVKITPNADVSSKSGFLKLVLNPVMKDGQWYLTLRDNDAEGIEQEDEIR